MANGPDGVGQPAPGIEPPAPGRCQDDQNGCDEPAAVGETRPVADLAPDDCGAQGSFGGTVGGGCALDRT